MSTNAWLRERATRTAFVRRSVSAFMPGERLEDAMTAAAAQERQGIRTIFTKLGENLTRVEDAEEVTQHYLEVLDKVQAAGLDAHISVKPTQLGLDLDKELCFRNLQRLVDRAEERQNFIWIDMEGSPYVDPTLDLYRRTRARTARIGIAIQAYLYRTEKDIESLLPLGAAIRMVKGAYLEPPDVAFPKKADVDENFYKLSLPAAQRRSAPRRRPAAHGDARSGARRSADGVHRRQQRPCVRLRIRDALWHSTDAAAAPARRSTPAESAHRLRRVPGSRGTCAGSPNALRTCGSSSRICCV